jgi:hypothetical protein
LHTYRNELWFDFTKMDMYLRKQKIQRVQQKSLNSHKQKFLYHFSRFFLHEQEKIYHTMREQEEFFLHNGASECFLHNGGPRGIFLAQRGGTKKKFLLSRGNIFCSNLARIHSNSESANLSSRRYFNSTHRHYRAGFHYTC